MITNHILEDKWRVQRTLSERAGHDPDKYMEMTHEVALEVQERYGVRFKYINKEDLLPGRPEDEKE